jgi:hypothetical protein
VSNVSCVSGLLIINCTFEYLYHICNH